MPDARQLLLGAIALMAGTAAAAMFVLVAPTTDPGTAPAGSTAVDGQVDGEAGRGGGGVGGSTDGRPGAKPAGQGVQDGPAGTGGGDPRRPSAPASDEGPGPDRRAGASGPRGAPSSAPSSGAPAGDSPRGGDAGSVGADGPPDGFRDQAAADRADWMEARMGEFLDTLFPESGGAGLSRSCSANGMRCTFEGPATDDFGKRWVQALAYGDMSEETLQGMTVRDFSFYETEEGLQFSIEARHPED